MPLRIAIAPREKIIINGAVISGGEQPLAFYVFNKAHLLRGREILKEEDADTIEKKLYFVIQLIYLFPEDAALNLLRCESILAETRRAWPQLADGLDEVARLVAQGNHYRALKVCGRLFKIRFVGRSTSTLAEEAAP